MASDHHRGLPQEASSVDEPSNTYNLPVPPHQIFAEQAVLGAILMDNEQYEKVADWLSAEDFYQFNHRVIYEAIVNLANAHQAVDVLTVKSRLEETGQLNDVGGMSYIVEIADSTPRVPHSDSYAKIVHDCSMLRRILRACQEAQQLVFSRDDKPIDKLLSDAQQKFYELGRNYERDGGLVHVKDAANRTFELIEELYNNPEKSSLTGVSTGFIDIDRITSGLQKSDLIVIAGRPSMGKTALAMNIAEHAAIREKRTVAVFSLEMPETHLARRSLSSLSSVDASRIRNGRLGNGVEGEQNWERIAHALNMLSNAPIFIDATPGISPLEITSRARRMKREIGLDLVIVDYLQLLQMKDNEANRATELSNITRELKFLAKELEIPVIALSQLNRVVENRPNKRPLMSDLRDSGAIEQDADLIMFVYRDEMYNDDSEDYGKAEIIISKHRNGETGKVILAFMKEFTRFENFSAYSDDSDSIASVD